MSGNKTPVDEISKARGWFLSFFLMNKNKKGENKENKTKKNNNNDRKKNK